jgi:DNA-binding NarL/FixJ family response regulator
VTAAVYTVVVADDIDDLRLLIRMALERSGRFQVVGEAADGFQAVAVASALRPDLTLLDLGLPVIDGLEALPRIRAAVPEGTVVVLSGLGESTVEERVLADGASGYLTKGLHPDEMVGRLLAILDGSPEGVQPPSVVLAGDKTASLALPADLTSPTVARAFVRSRLQDWGCDGLADSALLLTSELITNSLLHAQSSTHLHLSFNDGVLRVEVADRGGGNLALQEQDVNATSGRGLFLVESLARAWGTSASRDGRTVWFELA